MKDTTTGSEIVNPRRIPVEGIFLHYRIDDIVYGYLQASATFNPKEKILYIPKKNMPGIKNELQIIIGCRSATTITNKINTLIENKLLALDTEKQIYTFPYNQDERYKIIGADLLKELVVVYRPTVLKIFIYLLDKYEWKKQTNSEYVFTLSELAAAMGYAASSGRQDENTRIVLNHLRKTGLIDFEEFYELNENTRKPVPRMKLKFVKKNF